MTTLLYVITHAHTRADARRPASLWELSAVGRRQAEALAQAPFWQGVDRILLSQEAKTRLTVEPLLARRPLPVTVDSRFDELARGEAWVSDYADQVAQAFAEPNQSVAGWEPASQARDRFLAGVRHACERFAGQVLALVGHGLTLSLYRAHLLGRSRVQMDDWRNLAFASVAQVDPVKNVLLADFRPVEGAPITQRG